MAVRERGCGGLFPRYFDHLALGCEKFGSWLAGAPFANCRLTPTGFIHKKINRRSTHLPIRTFFCRDWGVIMPRGVLDAGRRAVQSERATHYREQAKHFERLASAETQPRTRARLLEVAAEYHELADLKPRKPSASSPVTGARNV